MNQEKIILGVDPGTNVLGYGIIHTNGKLASLITLGVIKLEKLDDHTKKLKTIFERMVQIIDGYHPDEMSIEAPFYGKNVQSMLKLGRAQGVCMAAALHRGIPICEYSPRKIKQSVTGRGGASKEQVAAMLKNLLQFKGDDIPADATDGLAAAVCHHFNQSSVNTTRQYGSWESYVKKNPKKLSKKK